MQLQVVGPEARDHGDGGAPRRVGEVRARELHQHRPVGGRRDELGGGPQIRGAGRCRGVDRDAGAAQEIREKRRCRRLPGRPRDAHGGNRRPLEHQVGQAPDDRAPLAQERDPRRDLRRPDVEERLVVRARIAVEACACAHDDTRCAELERLLRRVAGPRERDPVAFAGEGPGESDCVAVEPLDENARHERRGRGGAADPPRPVDADCARPGGTRSTAAQSRVVGLNGSAGTPGRPHSLRDRASATSPPCPSCRSGSTRARRRASRRRAMPSSRRTSSRRPGRGSGR